MGENRYLPVMFLTSYKCVQAKQKQILTARITDVGKILPSDIIKSSTRANTQTKGTRHNVQTLDEN